MWGKRSKDSLYNRSSVEKRQLLVSRYCSTYVLCYRIRHRYIIHTRIEANININYYRVFSLVEKPQSKKCIVTYIIDVPPSPPALFPLSQPKRINPPLDFLLLQSSTAYFWVHSRALRIASASLTFHNSATSFASGSSGLGALSRA